MEKKLKNLYDFLIRAGERNEATKIAYMSSGQVIASEIAQYIKSNCTSLRGVEPEAIDEMKGEVELLNNSANEIGNDIASWLAENNLMASLPPPPAGIQKLANSLDVTFGHATVNMLAKKSFMDYSLGMPIAKIIFEIAHPGGGQSLAEKWLIDNARSLPGNFTTSPTDPYFYWVKPDGTTTAHEKAKGPTAPSLGKINVPEDKWQDLQPYEVGPHAGARHNF